MVRENPLVEARVIPRPMAWVEAAIQPSTTRCSCSPSGWRPYRMARAASSTAAFTASPHPVESRAPRACTQTGLVYSRSASIRFSPEASFANLAQALSCSSSSFSGMPERIPRQTHALMSESNATLRNASPDAPKVSLPFPSLQQPQRVCSFGVGPLHSSPLARVHWRRSSGGAAGSVVGSLRSF